jgi:hypothetical protein
VKENGGRTLPETDPERELTMHFGSTDYLELIDKYNCNILFEKGAPAGTLKRDLITLTAQDGRAMEMHTTTGYHACRVELPREIFNDFIAASFIKQDGPEDAQGHMIFRLTPDGHTAARSRNVA